jgi:hypothetical protein
MKALDGEGASAGAGSLARYIQDLIGDWGDPSVERVVYGTTDPAQVAALADAFCREHLGTGIAAPLFYRAHVGSVFGVQLEDGRRLVVKVHQPDSPPSYLAAVQLVQRHLADQGFPCPRPLLEPTPLARGHATVEAYLADGEYQNPHEPAVRRALAQALARQIDLARGFVDLPGLRDAMRSRPLPPDVLWPTPHNAMFDFQKTAAGAEWIDEIAWRAKRIKETEPTGLVVLGHSDWSAKHFRFRGGEICAVYDWDSLRVDLEPEIIGGAAHGFTMVFDTPWEGRVAVAPSYQEVLAFITEYEAARGAPFTPAERRLARAACAYSIAYSSRCAQAVDPRPGQADDFPPGTFRESLAQFGERLLTL